MYIQNDPFSPTTTSFQLARRDTLLKLLDCLAIRWERKLTIHYSFLVRLLSDIYPASTHTTKTHPEVSPAQAPRHRKKIAVAKEDTTLVAGATYPEVRTGSYLGEDLRHGHAECCDALMAMEGHCSATRWFCTIRRNDGLAPTTGIHFGRIC